MGKAVVLTEEQLQEKCGYWQKILRLQDWIVKVEIKRSRDMKLPESQGAVNWVLTKKMAIIQVLDPVDFPPDTMGDQDMEVTLVHELLHLHFAPFDNFDEGTLEEKAIEQAIEAISEGLVMLHRKDGGRRFDDPIITYGA